MGNRIKETSVSEKEEFYSNSNMESITDVDYVHAKRLCKDFEIKNLGEYHGSYPKIDTLILIDVFVFRSCKKIFQLLD